VSFGVAADGGGGGAGFHGSGLNPTAAGFKRTASAPAGWDGHQAQFAQHSQPAQHAQHAQGGMGMAMRQRSGKWD